jgi:NAD(P)H-hydrate epimerase
VKKVLVSDLLQLTTDQMREVDRLMVEDYHICLPQMMENAGRNLADLAVHWLGGRAVGRRILVLCGMGNNGGGGMAAARHLHTRGASVAVCLSGRVADLKPVPAQQWRPLAKLRLAAASEEWPPADLILDALIGYGLEGSPRPSISRWIERANASGTPILALDAPSGLEATKGTTTGLCIRAAATLTLAMPKVGLLAQEAREWVGDLYLGDIAVPPELYAAESLGMAVVQPFEEGPIVRVLVS